MTEIERMKVDILTKELIGYCKNYGIPASYGDKIHLAASIVKAGYRKQSETVKEFADKVIDVIFSHSGIAQDCSKVLASPEILQDEINDLAAEFGKEE